MATVPAIPITVGYTSTATFTASAPIQYQFALDTTNPAYIRNATLTQDALYLQYYTGSVMILLTNLFQVASNALGALSWPPIINTQPTSSIVATGSNAYFSVGVSSELSNTYQWYSSSYSQSFSSSYSPLTNSVVFSGVTTTALTASHVSHSMSGSQFFMVALNASGQTTSSVVYLNTSN